MSNHTTTRRTPRWRGRHRAWAFFLAMLISMASGALTHQAFAGTTIPIPVTLSEPVTVTGTPRLVLDVGGTSRYATYTSGSGTNALTFTYTAQAGDLDLDGISITSPLDLNGGTITDAHGNAISPLTFTAPNTSGVKIDYPSLSLDFANSDYILNGSHYATLPSFLTAVGGSYSRSSVGTYFDSAGTLQTAASGTPRFDYDPLTHAAKGILIEESRTNFLLRSGDFTATWNPGYVTRIYAQSAPDGSTNAVKIEETTANNYHYLSQSYVLADSQTVTLSIFAKAGERNMFVLEGKQNDGTTYPAATFNLTTGTIATSNASVTASSIQPTGNGWYRCSITYSTGVGGGTGMVFILLYNGISSYTGTPGNGAYLWGAQLEVGGFPTSYIATSTSTATRSADFLTIPTASWYNTSSGSFFENVAWVSAAGSSYPMLWRVDDTTTNNRWDLYFRQSTSALGIDAYKSGTFQGGFAKLVATSGTAKAAAAQTTNSANAAFDGTLQTLLTSWSPPTVTQLTFGSGNSGASRWVASTKYYPARVSDSQLRLLTQ